MILKKLRLSYDAIIFLYFLKKAGIVVQLTGGIAEGLRFSKKRYCYVFK